jgi:hypothetical protein
MARPPSELGALHDTAIDLTPGVTTTVRGGPGWVAGMTGADVAAVPIPPVRLFAMTEKV